jgi:UDP-N-acetylmuramoyl-tripeptide--D-alanyl-D-alanine ligase
VWRRLLWRTTFIAVTGSVGKTTTKECLAAVFSASSPTAKSLYNQNDHYGVPRTILRVRPWHRFAIIEVGTDYPGLIKRSAQLLRPRVAIVLTVAGTHTDVFPTLDHIAAEKAQILGGLSAKGAAILNADDPRVRAMAAHRQCQVHLFGRSAGLALWADDISARWPARLRLRVHRGSETQWVHTRLVGGHWVPSVLATLLAAHVCGIALDKAIAALERVPPFMGRMQPVLLPNGATILRDEKDGSPDPFQAALQALAEAQAARRILVMSNLSFSHGKPRDRLRELGRVAAQVVDLAVFIGQHGQHAVKAAVASGMRTDCVRHFPDLYQAAQYLKAELRRGDVALIKGRITDHLSRAVFAQFGAIGCWEPKCHKTIMCDVCAQLRPEFELQALYENP